MDFTYDKYLAPMAIEKNQNPGSRFGELPATQHWRLNQFAKF